MSSEQYRHKSMTSSQLLQQKMFSFISKLTVLVTVVRSSAGDTSCADLYRENRKRCIADLNIRQNSMEFLLSNGQAGSLEPGETFEEFKNKFCAEHIIALVKNCYFKAADPMKQIKRCEGQTDNELIKSIQTSIDKYRITCSTSEGEWSEWSYAAIGSCDSTCGYGTAVVKKKRTCSKSRGATGKVKLCTGDHENSDYVVCDTGVLCKGDVASSISFYPPSDSHPMYMECSTTCGLGIRRVLYSDSIIRTKFCFMYVRCPVRATLTRKTSIISFVIILLLLILCILLDVLICKRRRRQRSEKNTSDYLLVRLKSDKGSNILIKRTEELSEKEKHRNKPKIRKLIISEETTEST